MAIAKRVKRNFKVFSTYLGIILGILLILMFFNVPIGKILVIIIMIFLAIISKLYKHFVGISIGFELITPVVILFAYKLNPLFTIISMVFMVVIADLISGQMYTTNTLSQLVIYTIIIFVVVILRSFDFFTIATAMIIFRNIALWLTMVVPGFVDPIKATIATLPNVFINGFILSLIAPVILTIL